MSYLHEPLLQHANTSPSPKLCKDINRLAHVVKDENMLQLMEQNISSGVNSAGQVLPSDRELNELVSLTNLKNFRQLSKEEKYT